MKFAFLFKMLEKLPWWISLPIELCMIIWSGMVLGHLWSLNPYIFIFILVVCFLALSFFWFKANETAYIAYKVQKDLDARKSV